MNISEIIYPAISLGGLGLIFGGGLAFASQKFAVKLDPLVQEVNDALPGLNCGACGYPGCSSFAKAVVEEVAAVDGCPVGGKSTAEAVAEVMGVEAKVGERQVAKVICNADNKKAKEDFDYQGIEDCKAASKFNGGSKSCNYGCLGLSTCVRECPVDAIHITENRIAKVDPDICISCEKCVKVCPKNVIDMVPESQEVVITCKNEEKGKVVRQKCDMGCIGCQICVKSCPFEAIDFENNLAIIDYDKCTNCHVCVEKCPTQAIEGDINNRKKAEIIQGKCIKCNICAKACPVDAIEGEVKEKHLVHQDQCIGCSVCAEKCPKDAIEMKKRK